MDDDVPPPPRPPALLSPADLHHICCHGYTGLTLPPALDDRFAQLRAAGDAFFAQPADVKDAYKPGAAKGPPVRPTDTERGYTCLPGEKAFLTLRRSLSHLPPDGDLPAVARAVWHDTAHLLQRILADMAGYLGLAPDAWNAVVADSLLPGGRGRDDPTTLLRLFRYEPGGGGAEPHHDLGLLTMCVCWGRGLQVRPQPFVTTVVDGAEGEPAVVQPWIDAPRVTVMTGETLHVLTRQRIPSAPHRVVVDSDNDNNNIVPRRSIVFALRATVVGDIDLGPLGSPGSVNAWDLYQSILQQRVNINTAKATRDAVRARRCHAQEEDGQASDAGKHAVGVA